GWPETGTSRIHPAPCCKYRNPDSEREAANYFHDTPCAGVSFRNRIVRRFGYSSTALPFLPQHLDDGFPMALQCLSQSRFEHRFLDVGSYSGSARILPSPRASLLAVFSFPLAFT